MFVGGFLTIPNGSLILGVPTISIQVVDGVDPAYGGIPISFGCINPTLSHCFKSQRHEGNDG